MSVVDIAKYQGETVSDYLESKNKGESDYGERHEELLNFTRDKINKEHPDLFLNSVFDPRVQEEAEDWIAQYVKEWIKTNGTIKECGTIEETIKIISDNILNLDILTPILEEKGVTDIFADGQGNIYYEAYGEHVDQGIKFRSEDDMLRVMKRLASAVGKPLNAEIPVANAQIGKNRFNVTLGRNKKGLADDHKIVIRVHRVEQFTPEELIKAEQITQEAADFLRDMAQSKEIAGMFFGPTGSGKSTSLDTFIISNMPDEYRIHNIEDEPELRSKEKYPNKKISEYITKVGQTEASTYGIARIIEEVSLRAKPDVINIGEIRKGVDGAMYLYAIASGHKGWSTGHSGSGRQGVKRIAKMVQQTRPQASTKEIEDDIFDSLDIIVFIKAIKVNGKKVRKVTEIIELYQDDKGNNQYRDIFKYTRKDGLKRLNTISEKLAQKLEDQEVDSTRWLKVGE